MDDSRIIVALDFPTAALAYGLVDKLDPSQCALKVGKELFVRAGPALVDDLFRRGFRVFLDLKFHDIPNTVAQACKAAADLGVWMMNVHCLGGPEMLEKAAATLESYPREHRPLLVGVTVLTSLKEDQLHAVGIDGNVTDEVVLLADLAHTSGLDGVVCSGQEAADLRQRFGDGFLLVTPGIRLPEGDAGDQKRVMTPERAIQFGADYLVVGRPITQAVEPSLELADFNIRVRSARTGSS